MSYLRFKTREIARLAARLLPGDHTTHHDPAGTASNAGSWGLKDPAGNLLWVDLRVEITLQRLKNAAMCQRHADMHPEGGANRAAYIQEAEEWTLAANQSWAGDLTPKTWLKAA